MAKKRRKKKNLRLKKTARYALGAVLMISAIIVAMVPTPEVQADGVSYNVTAADDISFGADDTNHPLREYREGDPNTFITSRLSNGSYNLSWQYKYYTGTFNQETWGVITKYNDNLARSSAELDVEVPAAYKQIEKATYESFYATSGDGNTPITLNTPYDTPASIVTFFSKYFPNEFNTFKTQYDQWNEWRDAHPEELADNPYTEPAHITHIPTELDETNRLRYYCDAKLATYGTDYTLQLVTDKTGDTDKEVYLMMGGTPISNYTNDSNGFLVESKIPIIAIGNKAFEGVENVDELILPQEIKYIGDEAFMESFIKSVSFVNVSVVGNRAFKNSNDLTSVTLGSALTTIGAEAFSGTYITSLPFESAIREIGPGAFSYCRRITNIDFSRMTNAGASIAKDAFYNCIGLNSVNFGDSTIASIGEGAFAADTGLTGNLQNFIFPGEVGTESALGDYVLAGQTKLTTVTLPGNYGRSAAAKIPNNTFANCIALGVVNFPDDKSGSCAQAYYEEGLFSSVTNPEFYVTGPEVNRTTDNPRTSTWAAKTAVSDTVPYRYTKGGLDYYEVSDGEYLLTVNTNGELTSCDLVDRTSTEPIDLVIPSQVGTIKVNTILNDCFSDNVISHLRTLEIEDDSVKNLSDGVFEGASKLEKVTIGNSVESIGNNVFKDCLSLVDVTFHTPPDYTSFTIGTDAFATGSKELTFHGDIIKGYAPFEWAMQEDNYMNTATGKRVCYRSNAPTNLTVIRDNVTGLVTLIDYPHYSNIDEDNAEYCQEMYDTYKALYGAAYTDDESKFSILEKYKSVFIDGVQPTNPWDNVNPEMLAIVNSTRDIEIPAGIESIDVNGFITGGENAANTAYLTDRMPNGLNGTDSACLKKNLYAGDEHASTFDDGVTVRPGLFSGELLDYFPAEEGNEAIRKGNDRITSISMVDVKYLPDYAFDDCEKLQFVSLGAVTDIGKAPFVGCTSLDTVNGNDTYQCANGIIYSTNADGTLTIESCLSTRGNVISPRTVTSASDPLLTNVSAIEDGAFQNCDDVTRVDLSDAAALKTIPEDCFNDCAALYEVNLPESVNKILDNAFTDNLSALRVSIPGTEVQITHDAFTHDQGVIRTYEDSAAYIYATLYGIDTEIIGTKYKVSFLDWDGTELGEDQYIESGSAAVPPEDPVRDGYIFAGWNKSYQNITKDTIIMATYTSSGEIKVTFLDYNGTELSVQYAAAGGNAVAPPNPTRTGYTFSGWSDTFSNITEEKTIVAQYTQNGTGGSGTGTGGTGTGGSNSSGSGSSGSGSGSSSKGSSGPDTSNKTYHKLTVTGGSGGGFYPEGYIVNISAYAPPAGQNFHQWTSTSNGVGFTNAYNKSTTFTMPGNEVTVVANFGVGTASSNNTVPAPTTTPSGGSGGSGGGSGGSGSGSNSTGTKPGGTVISITKPGFSDTDKASAVVHGSTDNYIIKITEDANAQSQIEAALLADTETLENIKYFPMDISLYDSTGTTKITDTTGISIDITLPLPDELREYGGNNKVAGVVNGALDKLTPTFKSIDGVPCVTFTATHFSPYTIYVDTANLSDGSIDSSPKTGDPIHPKWFLVIGLASLSIFLFAKKDRRIKIKIS